METTAEIIRVNQGEITVRERKDGRSIRETSGKYAVDEENRRIWFRASSEGAKPDGIDILAKAWKKDIKAFMADNPIIGEYHKYDRDAVGQAVDFELDDQGLLLQVEFARTDRGETLWDLYSNGFQRAVSVGWEVIEYKVEERGEGEAKRQVYVVTRAKLLEMSLVFLGMDDTALSKLREHVKEDSAREEIYRHLFEDEAPREWESVPTPEMIKQCVKETIDETAKQLVALVLEELYRDKVIIDGPDAEPEPDPETPEWKRKLAELAEINETMTSEELRARLDEIKHEVAT